MAHHSTQGTLHDAVHITGYTAHCSWEQNIRKSDKLSILSISVKPSLSKVPLLSALPPRVTSCYSVKLPLGETSQCLATLLRLSIVTCVCHLRINCNCPNCKVYLFKLQSVFVQITKCICPTSQSVLGNSFASLYCYHWLPARVTQRVSGCERGEKQTKR